MSSNIPRTKGQMFLDDVAASITQFFEKGYKDGKVLVRTSCSVDGPREGRPERGQKLPQIDLAKRLYAISDQLDGVSDPMVTRKPSPEARKFLKSAIRVGWMDDSGVINYPVVDAILFAAAYHKDANLELINLDYLNMVLPTVVDGTVDAVTVLPVRYINRRGDLKPLDRFDDNFHFYAFSKTTGEFLESEINRPRPSRDVVSRANQAMHEYYDWAKESGASLSKLAEKLDQDGRFSYQLGSTVQHVNTMLTLMFDIYSNGTIINRLNWNHYFAAYMSGHATYRLIDMAKPHIRAIIRDHLKDENPVVIEERFKRFAVTGVYATYEETPASRSEFDDIKRWLSARGYHEGLERAYVLQEELQMDWKPWAEIDPPVYRMDKIKEREITMSQFRKELANPKLAIVDMQLLVAMDDDLPLNIVTKRPVGHEGWLTKLIRPEFKNYLGNEDWISLTFTDGVPMTTFINEIVGDYKRLMGPFVTPLIVQVGEDQIVHYAIRLTGVRHHTGRQSGLPIVQLYSDVFGEVAHNHRKQSGTCLMAHMFTEDCAGLERGLEALSRATYIQREKEAPRAAFVDYKGEFRVLTTDDMNDKELLRVIADPA